MRFMQDEKQKRFNANHFVKNSITELGFGEKGCEVGSGKSRVTRIQPVNYPSPSPPSN
jgi:hypothetical protein